MKFSANLGFLWRELPLPEAIRAAARAGFDAVECHWPYDTPPDEVRAALAATGLPMLSLNTRKGDASRGDHGLAALPGREEEARRAIDEALDYANAIGAGMVHVMAGTVRGGEARRTFARNLRYAADRADALRQTVLIEALNPSDAPGYFLGTTGEAEAMIIEADRPNLKLLFDFYHAHLTERDPLGRFEALLPVIGHVQFAGIPGRGRPDEGEVDYSTVLAAIRDMGWTCPVGAEYRPTSTTEATLGWLKAFRGI